MNAFSFTRAWSKGLGFFSGAAMSHAILLLGVGILVPISLQVVLLGGPAMMLGSMESGAAGAASSTLIGIVTMAGWLLQGASIFASWHLGLRRDANLARALVFGLLAALMVMLGLVAVFLVFGLAASSAVPVLILLATIAMMAFLAIFATAFAAVFSVGLCLLFLIVLAVGAAGGDMTFAATVVGGGGWVWTVLVAGSLLVLWLAARLSCTTMLMAERRSFNLLAAMRDSWSLTWDDEWRIVRYLALLGLAVAVIAFAVAFAAGAGAGLATNLLGTSQPNEGIWGPLILQLLAVPFTYFSVMVPVGIYQELAPSDLTAAEVFA